MIKKEKIIFICTGNACRSQIAEGLMRHLASDRFEVYSAGTRPTKVHSEAVMVMREIGIDISPQTSDPISLFININMDIVVTLCDNVRQTCPVFPGSAEKIHWSIKDPSRERSFASKDYNNFRKVREEIREKIEFFLESA